MELVSGGDLLSWMFEVRMYHLGIQQVVFYASQIVLVLQFLHERRIVYRDLKPENILIGTDGYLRLTDFGSAKRLDKKPYRAWTLCGTSDYMAPEILMGGKGYSFSVDWWSLGILLFKILGKKVTPGPFAGHSLHKIYTNMADGKIDWPMRQDEPGHWINECARDLITQLLALNGSRRLGNLQNGNGAEDVKEHPFFEGVDWERLLEKSIDVPWWKPQISLADDTQHFDEMDENTDNENQELDYDPFEQLKAF